MARTSAAADTLCSLSARELRAGFAARDFTPVEALDALAARIEEREPAVNAFVTLVLEEARTEARRAEDEYARGDPRPLAGIAVAVKDLMDTAELTTTYGSPIFAGHVPERDAEVVRRVREAGGIVLGKTLTHEFAWGITSLNAHFPPCRNPWAPDRVPGGSSGGAAVALACGEVPLALGSDTGGSVRIPAAFCGVVGMKPTFGRVSTAGVFSLAPSLDHVGSMARTPSDARLLLDAIADPGGEPARGGGPAAGGDLSGVRVAVCPDLHPVALTPAIEQAFDRAVEALAHTGAEIVEVAAPAGRDALAIFGPIQLAEALHTHREAGIYPARAADYGEDVRARLELAGEVGLDDYLRAQERRRALTAELDAIFQRADLLITPVSAGPPVRREEASPGFRDVVMPYTVPQDLAGLPACALPAGSDELGIPIGVQLTGARFDDARVLDAAEALHDALGGPGIAPGPQ